MCMRNDTQDERDSDLPPTGSTSRPFITVSDSRRAISLGEKDKRWSADQATIAAWSTIAPVYPLTPKGKPDVFHQTGTDRACVGYAVAAALRCHRIRNESLDAGKLNPYFLYGAALARAQNRAQRVEPSEEGASTLAPSAKAKLMAAAPDPANVIPSIEDVLVVANEYGTPLQDQGPGEGFMGAPDRLSDHLPAARPNRLRAWVSLGVWQQDWYRWLKKAGPIVVQMNVEEDAFRKCKGSISYRYPAEEKEPGEKVRYGGHAAVIVGYDSTRLEDSSPKGFVVLNSYGPDWGQGGIAYISPRVAQKCFVAGYGLLNATQLDRLG